MRGHAAGAITQADITRRARELALIRSNSEEFTDEDLRRAELELTGGAEQPDIDDDEQTQFTATRDPSDPVGDHGSQTIHANQEDDEQTAPERLAQQGVDEAQHDLMIEARRRAEETSVPDPERPGSKP